jgi:hypothetical protein
MKEYEKIKSQLYKRREYKSQDQWTMISIEEDGVTNPHGVTCSSWSVSNSLCRVGFQIKYVQGVSLTPAVTLFCSEIS